jgi:hypothetical protein
VPGPNYYRRQADLCFRLALLAEDRTVAELLALKGMQFLAQAEDAGNEAGILTPISHLVEREPPDDGDVFDV